MTDLTTARGIVEGWVGPYGYWERSYDSLVVTIATALQAQREKDMEACRGEFLTDDTGKDDDVAYNNAINHCIAAIRAGGQQ